MSTTAANAIPSEIVSLLETRQYADAIALLENRLAETPTGDGFALLGLAHFQQEAYAEAATSYAAALEMDAGNLDWREMLASAQRNAVAELNVAVPDVIFFDRKELLAGPIVVEGTLPSVSPPPRRRSATRWLRDLIGDSWGVFVSVVMEFVTWLIGRFLGYRDEVWTNWYRRPFLLGVLTLAHMRNRLSRLNLKNTYPDGELTGFADPGLTPPAGVRHYRTTNGTWNNLQNPKEGAAGTRFLRNVDDDVAKPASEELLTPNPRELSRIFLTREDSMKEIPFLNLLAASWIQFQNHDWISHGEVMADDLIEIPLADDDPARTRFWQTKMFVSKTQPDPTRHDDKEKTPVTFINEVTHWWDGSQIYGSDQKTADHLRSHVDGKLRLNGDRTLPLNKKRMEETGFVRNWWVGLTMLHNVFVLEHNAICDSLIRAYPDWSDNQLYNVARLINAAVMAKIHSIEWTPAVLPNRVLDSGLNANWYGLLTNLLTPRSERKTVARINISNPEMGGIVGNPIRRFGEPYGLSEEFVEVYRLHSFLPEELHLKSIGKNGEVEKMPFVASRQAGSRKITERIPVADLFYSFGTQHPGQLVLNNFPKFMQEMSIPGNPLFDLGAVDILRARERGVPRYNEFRRQLGLNPIRSFEDLNDDPDTVRKLKEAYGHHPADVEKLDLLIGTLGESHRPDFFGFGETMFQIFILNASRRLQADRFYTTCYNEETYTELGLEWIDATDFKTVLLRHYPELARTGLANVGNAFEPWDTDERLDPARHPLRAYVKEIKSDPWKGDSYK